MNKKKYINVQYEMREIKDLKDLMDTSALIYSDQPAYLVKKQAGGEYEPVKFWQCKEDVDSLGTAFCSMGLKGKRIAVIGENSYEWVVTYMATVNGTGTIVPLDKELPPGKVDSEEINKPLGPSAPSCHKSKAVLLAVKLSILMAFLTLLPRLPV